MPENAVKVDRSGYWGNPYRLDDDHQPWSRFPWRSRERAQACVDHYARSAEQGFVTVPYTHRTPEERGDKFNSFGAHRPPEVAAKYLGGKDLACWCELCPAHADGLALGVECLDCAPCHGDVLLRWANPDQVPA
jgi:hypothetical protein